MRRYRQIGALAIAATGSLALFASTADAHALAADCNAVTPYAYPDAHSRVVVDVAVNGAVEGTTAYEIDGDGGPLAVPFRTPPFAGDLVEVSASSLSSDGFAIPRTLLFSSRACGPARSAAPVDTPGPAEHLPGAAVRPVPMPRIVPGLHPQKPRPRGCAAIPRGAGLRWYAKRGCVLPARFTPRVRNVAVAGSVQTPSPATLVAGLLYSVPQLAQDVPFASSIHQSAGGRSSSGGVSAAERGRLVPLAIPGHPWTSKSTAPGRGVAVSVAWRMGRLTVRVLYSASRGSSTTTVSAR